MKYWIPGLILACTVVALSLWMRSAPEVATASIPAPAPTMPTPPAPVEAPMAEAPKTPVVAAFSKATTPEPEAAEPEGIPRPEQWTEKTLAGTTWKTEGFDFSFGKDGTWHMAGRAASKWRVEGDRIKLFDDKGEVHYIEIEGDQLTFNGKPVGRPVARE